MDNKTTELQGSVKRTPLVKHLLHKVLDLESGDLKLNKTLNQVDNKSLMQGDKQDLQQNEKASDQIVSKQEIKQMMADKKEVAVTSEEHAIEFEKKADELEGKTKEEVKKELEDEEDDDTAEKERKTRLAKEAMLAAKKEDLKAKIEKEIEIEIEKSKLLYMLENARKNAIDATRAAYGEKADIASIQRTYDIMANTIDPKLSSATDLISMAIDNKLHGKENVKMLMPNGSIRTMDADVAMALSEIPERGSLKKKQYAEIVDELGYTQDELDKLYELSELMDDNAKKQEAFEYKDPKSGEAEIKSVRDKRLRKLGLPTVAMDYDYVYHLDETTQHNGRALPSAMDSYDMQPGMQGNGKTYGFYQ